VTGVQTCALPIFAALADALERASARLSRTKPERGPVRALRERIEQIVWLARELAFRCDSEHVKPEPPPGGPVMGSDLDRGLRQLWIHLADAVERLGTEASIPRLPWDGGRYGTDFGVTWDDHEARYVVFLNR